MKRTVTLAAAALLVASAALAETNVLSQNAVGYIKVEAGANQYKLIGSVFNPLEENATVASVLGTNDVPAGTRVFLFNQSSQTYVQELMHSTLGWLPGTNIIEVGDGMWLVSPSDKTFYMMGEVPANTTNNVDVVAGYQLLTFPYPTGIAITNTFLNTIAKPGDRVFTFDGTNYHQALKHSTLGWLPADFTLNPGEGFWYTTSSNFTWQETKPYEWP
jgi:hypothetical protein